MLTNLAIRHAHEEQAAGQEEDLGHVPVPESDPSSDEDPIAGRMARVSRMRAPLSSAARVHETVSIE
jgi:hypothetical protein